MEASKADSLEVGTGAHMPRAEVTLLEVEPGVAVLFGEGAPQGWDLEAFGLGEQADRQLVDALSLAASAADLLTRGSQGLASAQGLVRLAPETVRSLQSMQTMVKDGYNLGVLTQGGKFAAHVRWVPATGAQAASVLQGVGPALPLLAVSAQLTLISRKVDENTELTRGVLRALHEDHWNALSGMYETVMSAIEESREVRAVTSRTFDRVKHLEPELRAERRYFASHVDEHVKGLDADYAARRAYLRDSVQQILADVQGLVMAETAWCGYQMLRAGEIASDPGRSAEDEERMRLLSAQVPAERSEAVGRVASVLAQLDAQCHLAAETSGRTWRPRDLRSRRGSAAIDQSVSTMARYVARLRGRVYEEPLELSPAIKVLKEEASGQVLSLLRWALPAEEPLVALAEVEQDGIAGAIQGVAPDIVKDRVRDTTCYLGVTPDRIFLTSASALSRDGRIERSVPLADVRYVRFRPAGRASRKTTLDIITKNENLCASFGDWVASGSLARAARRFADILMTAARIPEEEKRHDPLLAEMAGRSRKELEAGELVG